MGTRARVALALEGGRYRSIYTHWDGYPSHHGPILTQCYDTPEKLTALLDLGDLSALCRKLAPAEGQPHNFEKRQEGVCLAYGRDRGEEDTQAVTSESLDDLLAISKQCGARWLYVLTADGWQHMGVYEDPSALRELVEPLAEH